MSRRRCRNANNASTGRTGRALPPLQFRAALTAAYRSQVAQLFERSSLSPEDLLDCLHGRPVLSDAQRKISLEANLQAPRDAGLNLSSKLPRLATEARQ